MLTVRRYHDMSRTIDSFLREQLRNIRCEIWSIKNWSGKPWICQRYKNRDEAEEGLMKYKNNYPLEKFEIREVYE
jgi:hypothetical protein